jgi:hypothetical protein
VDGNSWLEDLTIKVSIREEGEIMLRNLFVIEVLTVVTAPRVSAEPLPLLEFNFQQTDFENGPLPAKVEFRFEAFGEFSTQYLDWTAEYSSTDVGISSWATFETVAGANLALMDLRADYALWNGPGNFVSPVSFSKVFVDDLPSYSVSAVERVIDYLVLTEIQPHVPPAQTGHWTIAASQTIRYWGVLVPEPYALPLMLLGVWHLSLSCRRRRRS